METMERSSQSVPSSRGKAVAVLHRLHSAPESMTRAPANEGDNDKASSNRTTMVSTRTLAKRSVSFDVVEIREYARCLSHNPATTHGPSIGIDWHYEDMGSYKITDYESARPPRRETSQMQMPAALRESIIMQHTKCTKREISEHEREVRNARHQRQLSIALQDFEGYIIMFESLGRKVKRWRNGISKKREQELLWENAQLYEKNKEVGQRKLRNNCEEDSTSSDSSGIK